MKAEALLRGIGKIRSRYVREAAPAEQTLQRAIADLPPQRTRRTHKMVWSGAVAAVLVVAIFAGSLLLPNWTTTASALALAEATYPTQVPYPDETEYWVGDTLDDSFYTAYDAWRAQRKAAEEKTPDASYLATAAPFTDKLVRQLLTGTENQACSPMNLYMALAMLAEMTDGQSRAQVLNLLGVSELETLRTQAKNLWESVYVDDGLTTTRLANSIWLAEDRTYHQPLLDTLAQNYYASSYSGKMGSGSVDRALQDWINQQTSGLLKSQTEGIQLDADTVIALVSTIYFKARWSEEFPPSLTAPDSFTCRDGSTLECDFMHQEIWNARYYYGEGYTALALSFSYSGDMMLILPDEGWTTDDLLQREDVCSLLRGVPDETVGQASPKVNLSMPKFDVTSDLDLSGTLQTLGVEDVFFPGADFSPVTDDADNPCLRQARQAIRVVVDEEGCEAAAFTLMTTTDSAAPEPGEEVDFILNRPFLFSITGVNHLPLFVGTVQCPA